MSDVPLEIDCHGLRAKQIAGEPHVLIDCREQSEYDKVHLSEALLMPMNSIPERLGELEQYRNSEIIVHCHHGGRSLRVVHWLRGQGFAQARSLAGGIDDWAVHIDPSLPRY